MAERCEAREHDEVLRVLARADRAGFSPVAIPDDDAANRRDVDLLVFVEEMRFALCARRVLAVALLRPSCAPWQCRAEQVEGVFLRRPGSLRCSMGARGPLAPAFTARTRWEPVQGRLGSWLIPFERRRVWIRLEVPRDHAASSSACCTATRLGILLLPPGHPAFRVPCAPVTPRTSRAAGCDLDLAGTVTPKIRPGFGAAIGSFQRCSTSAHRARVGREPPHSMSLRRVGARPGDLEAAVERRSSAKAYSSTTAGVECPRCHPGARWHRHHLGAPGAPGTFFLASRRRLLVWWSDDDVLMQLLCPARSGKTTMKLRCSEHFRRFRLELRLGSKTPFSNVSRRADTVSCKVGTHALFSGAGSACRGLRVRRPRPELSNYRSFFLFICFPPPPRPPPPPPPPQLGGSGAAVAPDAATVSSTGRAILRTVIRIAEGSAICPALLRCERAVPGDS